MHKFKAYFRMPITNDTVTISNTTEERLEPAIEQLERKGFILEKTNYDRWRKIYGQRRDKDKRDERDIKAAEQA
jgi:hypothetical protein